VLNKNNVNRFNQGINLIAFGESRFFKAVSRHHGREPDSIILSAAYSHHNLRHNIISFNIFNFASYIIAHASFHTITS